MTPNTNIVVSIVIPTYNRMEYIVQAIQSAYMQSYKNIEIIVVDDGSTDQTSSLLEQFFEGKIRYIYQYNQGVSEARNRGIDNAKGKYIAFLDSDDLWEPDHIKDLLDGLTRYPKAKVAFSAVDFFGEADDVRLKIESFTNSVQKCLERSFSKTTEDIYFSNERLLATLIRYGFPFRCQAALVEKRFIQNNNLKFDKEISYTEDAQFMTLASFYTPFIYVDRSSCKIRRHRGNDGDWHYTEKLFGSYITRVNKTKEFFKYAILTKEEKNALQYMIWEHLSCVAFSKSNNQPLIKRIHEGVMLFKKVPCLKSLKSTIKLIFRLTSKTVNSLILLM